MLLPSIAEQRTVTLGIAVAWPYAALPVSIILMFVLTARAFALRLVKIASLARE